MIHTANARGFIGYLQESGRVSAESAVRLLSVEQETKQPVDIIIRELGIMPETAIAEAISCYLQVPFISALAVSDDYGPVSQLGHKFVTQNAILPHLNEKQELVLTVANPFDADALKMARYLFDSPAIITVASRSIIDERIATTVKDERLDVSSDGSSPDDEDLERLRDIAQNAPVIKFVSSTIQKAVDAKISDIHFEPDGVVLRVRFRTDGMLVNTETAPKTLHAGVVSRLKILARLNIAERRLPQDGRVRIAVRGQEIDFRLSVVPTVHGESVVLRILDRETIPLDLEALGYDQASSGKIRQLIHRANGMVLVTGPTGSGKTTTLYAMLSELNRPEVKIITVEDPVEYRMSGIVQLQIDPGIGLSFATALRSVLRQDPDVILIGEIRDRETAQIAIQAALTGHLVLATLHTNNAIGAISRLRDMGIDSFLIDATLRGVIGQRLLRRCCQECKGMENNDSCTACGGTGYKGRQATFEILQMSESIRGAFKENLGREAIESIARKEGMVPIREQARLLALAGTTTHTEVTRVVDLEDA